MSVSDHERRPLVIGASSAQTQCLLDGCTTTQSHDETRQAVGGAMKGESRCRDSEVFFKRTSLYNEVGKLKKMFMHISVFVELHFTANLSGNCNLARHISSSKLHVTT